RGTGYPLRAGRDQRPEAAGGLSIAGADPEGPDGVSACRAAGGPQGRSRTNSAVTGPGVRANCAPPSVPLCTAMTPSPLSLRAFGRRFAVAFVATCVLLVAL